MRSERRRVAAAALAALLVGLLLGGLTVEVGAGTSRWRDASTIGTRPARVVSAVSVRPERRAGPAKSAPTGGPAPRASLACVGVVGVLACSPLVINGPDASRSRAPPS
jgi:hypothetical protein